MLNDGISPRVIESYAPDRETPSSRATSSTVNVSRSFIGSLGPFVVASLIGDLLVTYLQRQSRPKRSTERQRNLGYHTHAPKVRGRTRRQEDALASGCPLLRAARQTGRGWSIVVTRLGQDEEVQNGAMEEMLADINWRERVAVPAEVDEMIDAGVIEENGCVPFRRLAEATHPGRDRFPDDTGYEAFVNHFHLDADTPTGAVKLGHRVAHTVARLLRVNVDRPCRVILALDGASASIRFHVRREGEEWLSADLEGYAEPVLVLDYEQIQGRGSTDYPLPRRAEIEARWRDLIAGAVSREAVNLWAEPFVLGDEVLEPLVASALQYLHGFDLVTISPGRLRHGGPGEYLRSIDEVAAELVRWLANCRDYDNDPRGYMKRSWERARLAAREERGR